MPTILSRFDTIFIVKDEHDQQRDMVSRIQCDHHLWLLLARSNRSFNLYPYWKYKYVPVTLHSVTYSFPRIQIISNRKKAGSKYFYATLQCLRKCFEGLLKSIDAGTMLLTAKVKYLAINHIHWLFHSDFWFSIFRNDLNANNYSWWWSLYLL